MKLLSRLFQPEQGWKSFAPIAIPVIVIIALLLGVMSTLAVLTHSINQQIESGTTVLNYNLSDQSRVFVQLQRETLKMIVLLTNNEASQDRDVLQLQYELLTSRINHTNVSVLKDVAPAVVVDNTQIIIGMWNTVYPNIDTLLTNLTDDRLRTDIIAQLHELELLANSTEIDYSRARTVTLPRRAVKSH